MQINLLNKDLALFFIYSLSFIKMQHFIYSHKKQDLLFENSNIAAHTHTHGASRFSILSI